MADEVTKPALVLGKSQEPAMRAEDALRAGAVAAFTQAQALSQEAQRLAAPAQAPRAAALALLGAEAFAHAVLCTVAALVPAHRHALPGRRADPALTQHICTMAAVAQRMARTLWTVASAFGSPTALSRLGALFATLAEWGPDGLLNPAAARAYDSARPRTHAEDQRDGPPLRAQPAPNRDLAARGQGMSPPPQVDPSEARARIGGLACVLAAYALLPTVVGDDQRWRAFAARVRHGLPDPETRPVTPRQTGPSPRTPCP